MDINPISPTMASDERLLLLAMALDTRVGLTFGEMVDKGLMGDVATVKSDSVRHAFALYRRQLEEIGIRVEEVASCGETRYRLDPNVTYADPRDIDLSEDEALSLFALLTQYLEGARVPYAAACRAARTKLACALGLGDAPQNPVRTGRAPDGAGERRASSEKTGGGAGADNGEGGIAKAFATLMRSYANRHAVSFCYTNAQGQTKPRCVELYGMFERYGRTYFVGNDLSVDARPETLDGVRVFRDDRIDVRTIKALPRKTYDIPPDFLLDDHIRLPFQYGSEPPFAATFAVDGSVGDKARRDVTMGKGSWRKSRDGQGAPKDLWTVEANDARALASWALYAADEGFALAGPPEALACVARGLQATEVLHG